MNAVEIEEAVSQLIEQPFDASEFPFLFLEAFDNPETTVKRLRRGTTNKSDVDGVLQTNNIHIKTCEIGQLATTFAELQNSPATKKSKVKFVLATDGQELQAEDLNGGQTLICNYSEIPDHFGFFLPLAGITTVAQIRENAFDIRATSRLNKLYIELLKHNPDWGTDERRHDMNHFMARLIFCFFAEDTDIFAQPSLFTATVDQMSDRDASNVDFVIGEIFRAMNCRIDVRDASDLRSWANTFPYVNGGLFSGSTEVPEFSKIARSYLINIGSLDWKQINPDIFGSMIQAVADDEERSALGMHYTSVPNILKVLNPLFLDDLREQLEAAGDNRRKLKNLRERMGKIRVFDPACGSGNFLVVAYKEMRKIEAEINERRGEQGYKTVIPMTNYRGIELRDFSAEIARLALIIAEYQCDVLYRGQKAAKAEFLPLDKMNWITCGNALRLDWLSLWKPTETRTKIQADDLFGAPLDQAEIDFENQGGETFICGNPPYLGSTWQTKEQKEDLQTIFEGRTNSWKSLDYVAGWFIKAADYGMKTKAVSAFVSTNSICQGQQVPILWPLIFSTGHEISFAHTSFKWANLASHNAGVTVVIVGIFCGPIPVKTIFSIAENGRTLSKKTCEINAYLVANKNVIVSPKSSRQDGLAKMEWGNKPTDGGNLILNRIERDALAETASNAHHFIRRYVGSQELAKGMLRWCLWITDEDKQLAIQIEEIKQRIISTKQYRLDSTSKDTQPAAAYSHRFRQIQNTAKMDQILVSGVSSENREFLPADVFRSNTIASNKTFAMYDAPLWNLSLVVSRIHWVWIGTVCVRMRTDFSYSNTLGWNTFPVPTLTEQNKADLTRCAEDILLAREAHFPATIADLYNPEKMPENLRAAHDRNDEVLERIYIGRRFKNDTERLEKLFELYVKMTEEEPKKKLRSMERA